LGGGGNKSALEYVVIFNCGINEFPLKYLRVSISTGRLHVADWVKLEEKSAKRLDVWQGGNISYGGRLILINASLTNSSIYHMSMFLLPKKTIKIWTNKEEGSFGRVGASKRNIIWSDGPKCAERKRKGSGDKKSEKDEQQSIMQMVVVFGN
jgi:hypothetical protein